MYWGFCYLCATILPLLQVRSFPRPYTRVARVFAFFTRTFYAERPRQNQFPHTTKTGFVPRAQAEPTVRLVMLSPQPLKQVYMTVVLIQNPSPLLKLRRHVYRLGNGLPPADCVDNHCCL